MAKRAKKGEGYNKFLPPFDKGKAEKLLHILRSLDNGSYSVKGVIINLEDILQRPSYIQKRDVDLMKELFEAIKKV